MKTYKTLSLGCKVNTYETEAIKQLLDKHGYKESDDDNCDLFIINTCAVTAVGEQKSRQLIRKAKKVYPNAKIAVMGCFSQLHPEVVNKIEGVDIILGTSERSKLIDFLEENEKVNNVKKDNRHEEYECLNISSYSENTRAFVKIQDGCNNFCTYCIIPYTRGNFRSRNKEDILNEVKRLADNGYKEIVLTGIDTAGYGKEKKDGYYFNDLLKDILKEERIKRIRISSIEASQIDDEFIEILKNNPRVARHLHIPLQSGSASVLKRMKRKYTKEEFLAKMCKIKEHLPDIALACDVIVGFPGESEEEFVECMNFIKECDFNFLHVFPYSPRPGTPAASMPDQIDPRIKKERVRRLIKLGDELKEKYEDKFLNQEVEVLFESFNKDANAYLGHTSNYLEVSLKSNENLTNQLVKVKYKKI